MNIRIAGALVGWVCDVRPHPRGSRIWMAHVDLGNNVAPVQIVFGGDRKLLRDELAPVAPPGSLVFAGTRVKKMRTRRYRGERSQGMLCSLDELGWISGGPNEVAILRDVLPGQRLDDLPAHRRAQVVVDWQRAKQMEWEATGYAAMTRGLPAPPWRGPQPPTSGNQT
jgi:tRNA-binding EMAP/Myf-like protein